MNTFHKAAKNSPDPDQPVFGFMGTKVYSASEIASEVENETAFGKDVIEMVALGARKDGMDKTVERITRKPPSPDTLYTNSYNS